MLENEGPSSQKSLEPMIKMSSVPQHTENHVVIMKKIMSYQVVSVVSVVLLQPVLVWAGCGCPGCVPQV